MLFIEHPVAFIREAVLVKKKLGKGQVRLGDLFISVTSPRESHSRYLFAYNCTLSALTKQANKKQQSWTFSVNPQVNTRVEEITN